MTLTVHTDLIQGSDEWLTARRGIVTASVVGQLVTAKTIRPAVNDYSRALTTLLVSERITGWTEPVYVSDAMMRGSDDEPIARDAYARHMDVDVTVPGFMVREFGGRAQGDPDYMIGYSPDGLVGDDGLIEIKSRAPKKHLATILAGVAPAENMAQMQAGLLVSGRAWCDYVSFCGGMPLWTCRVLPDPRWFAAITEAVATFEATAVEMVATYRSATAGLPMTERTTYQEVSF